MFNPGILYKVYTECGHTNKYVGVMQLADILDLKSKFWGFESPFLH